MPPDRDLRGHRRPRGRRGRGAHRRPRPHRRPHRGGDGGADRGRRRRADAARHGQGGGPGRGARRGPGRAQGRRQDRHLDPAGRPMTRTAVVIIASSRAAAGVYPDRTGPLIETWLSNGVSR